MTSGRRIMVVIALSAMLCVGLGGAAYVFAPTPAVVAIDPATIDLSALDAVSPQTWEALRGKRIYFGHQSVGSNIVAGLEEILRRKPSIGLRVAKATDPDALTTPAFVHGPIGRNLDVDLKLADFAQIVRGPMGERLDMALMKFCYADLMKDGDPKAMFESYRATMDQLAGERPTVRILHASIPLTKVQVGPKARIKAILGKRAGVDNVARGQYNRMLRESYGPEQVFDVAESECRLPDGTQVLLAAGADNYQVMAPAYTDDGGHLNATGQVKVARDLLLFLAKQCAEESRREARAAERIFESGR